MAETRKLMSSKGAGNATDFSSSQPHDLGVSDAHGVNLKTKHDEFFKDLDALVGKGRLQGGCSIGYFMDELEQPIKDKLEEGMTKADAAIAWKEQKAIIVSKLSPAEKKRRRLT